MSVSGRLVVLSGPSCIGKSPLVKALAQFHPDLHKKLQRDRILEERFHLLAMKTADENLFRRLL